MVPHAQTNVVIQNLLVSTSRKEISWCNKARLRGASRARAKVWARLQGLGLGLGGASSRVWGPAWPNPRGLGRPGAWGPGPRGWGPGPACDQFFVGWRRGGSQLNNYDETRSDHGPVGNTLAMLHTCDY